MDQSEKMQEEFNNEEPANEKINETSANTEETPVDNHNTDATESITETTVIEETPEMVVEPPAQTPVETAPPAIETIEVANETFEHPVETENLSHDVITEEEEAETAPDIDYSVFSRPELIDKLEELVKNPQVNKIKKDVTNIKVTYLTKLKTEKQEFLEKFLAEGGTKENFIPDTDQLEERFKRAFDIYKENKIKDDEAQEKLKLQNLEAKKQILEELKNLIASEESLKKTHDEFKALQDKWKEIGMVPRTEMEGLWNNYHFLVEKFFEKVKINKELKDLDLKKNMEAKLELCEKVEELLLEKSITKTFKLLQEYHDQWKEIGPVPLDKKDEIWERFKNVSDKINQHRKEYYESQHAEQENNFLAKSALCEKVEEIIAVEITSNNDWKEKTDQILEMQRVWESIGRAPAKSNDEVWERFRNAINTFFNNKKEFFSELKDQQLHNYNLKLDICAHAEGLIDSTNWKQSTNDLLKLQQDWKQIGPVPKRYSDKVWKRFRAACDAFFAKKSEYYSNIQQHEMENLKKKEELIEKVNAYESMDDKKADLENLKNFQREWVDIGFVPMSAKEKLQADYKTAINNLMDKLKVSQNDVNTLNYRNRIENIQHAPDAKGAMYKERVFLEGKISKLKTEIMQLENNLGFFASSKKADLLKEEFEKKIQGAKQELALMEAKLKMLRNQ